MPRPNIVFILADDLGYADLGCYGARDAAGRPAMPSPRLDALSERGVRFTRAYANSAVCSPTRFALLTGRWQYRLRGAADEPLGRDGERLLGLPPEHPTLPSLLRDAGYATALVGKWHLGCPPLFGPRKSGYGMFYGFHAGAADYFARCDSRGQPDFWRNETPIADAGYLTDLLSRAAVEFIEAQTPDRPFLLSLHYNAPHWPWQAREDQAESTRIAGRLRHLDGGSIETYQRMIHHMDEGVGWVLDALARRGHADNTLVVFTSDNGGERFSNQWPFVGQKMDLLEGGIRVPLIACWPRRLRAGATCEVPHQTMDWTATMLHAAGVAPHPDYPLDGASLLPALDGEAVPGRPLFWRMTHRGQKALVQGDWKYLEMDGVEYLFDLATDARERANLRERDPQRLQRMRRAWTDWNETLPGIPDDARVAQVFTHADLPRPSA